MLDWTPTGEWRHQDWAKRVKMATQYYHSAEMSEISSRTKNRSPSPCSRGLVGLNSAVRLGFPVSFPVAFALVADIYLPTQSSLLPPHTSSFFSSGGYVFFLLPTPRLRS